MPRSHNKPSLVYLILGAALIGGPSSLGAVRISEFMAENDGTVLDGDGKSSDWIELHNNSTNAVNLAGWHLTDEPKDLTRWTFPATNLPANGYLLVFASGQNRMVAGAELHTNFELDKAGNYLALVEPDGTTVAQAFSPMYPRQLSNVSFGAERSLSTNHFVSPLSPARFLAPTNGSIAADWREPGFDASNWTSAAAAIGFAAGGGGSTAGRIVLPVDFNDDDSGETGAANTEPGFTGMTLTANPSTINGVTVALSPIGGGVLDDRDRATPTASPTLTQDQLYDDFIFVNGQANGNGLRISISQLRPLQDYQLRIWSFDSGSAGGRGSDWIETASGQTNVLISGYRFDGATLPSVDGDDTFAAPVRSSASGELRLEGRRSGGTSHGVFLNALQLVEVGYQSVIGTDVSAAMTNRTASAYLRVPFTVEEPVNYETLELRIRYDDAFVAYINGRMVASRNAPAAPAWNSTALSKRPKADALVAETMSLPVPSGLLVAGTNLLAIHGLNSSPVDPEFLLVPELSGLRSVEGPRYFTNPTPGLPNSGTAYDGFVDDTKFSVNRGFFEAPFFVTITNGTPGSQIFWTTNGSVPSPANGRLYTGPILVSNTVCLRAAAFKSNFIASDVDTHSYLFLSQVLRQPATMAAYPATWQASYPADYGMDSNVVNHPVYGPSLTNDLRSIPSLSIVTDHNSLWNTSTGIYVNSTMSGQAWERPGSAELINQDGSSVFAVRCAIRMQGNASRDNVRTPKHSLRLLFKSEYGPSKLSYNWFPDSPVAEFDNIVLRACFTDSWSTRSSPGDGGARYRPDDSLYLRDVWMKDSLASMGHLSGRGNFVHLYLNGLYWGLYNPVERLDGSYFAHHLGGNKEDWDVIRDFSEVLDGSKADWSQMMARVNAGVRTEADYQAVASLVNMTNLIDYMMLHIFAEAEDWPSHNWYAAHRRATNGLAATPWIFLAWDQEIVLDQVVRRNRLGVSDNDTPARIYSQLRNYPEFRRLFGDRIQMHLFNGGALTPGKNAARLAARASQIERAVTGESARWGDAREFAISPNPGTGKTFTRDEYWTPELQKLYTSFFPKLNAENIARFRSGSLYPAVEPPIFNQFGGVVPAGFQLILQSSNTTGAIYYTTDGADPRVYGSGAVGASSKIYSAPVSLASAAPIRSRVLRGGEWSALVEAAFYPAQDFSKLIVTEIMYHPENSANVNDDDSEFIELNNTGAADLDLSGVRFSAGVDFAFSAKTVLAPGKFLVLVHDSAHFSLRYPAIAVAGQYTGNLDNGGETITLSDASGGVVFSLRYRDTSPWPAAADGTGLSLQRFDLTGEGINPAQWLAAAPTPGAPYREADTDGDGLPDSWEIAHGTNVTGPDAGEDHDHDGLTNAEEFALGTDPRDPGSAFRITRVTAEAAGPVIEFQAVPNRTYSVLYKTFLEDPAWIKLVDFPASGVSILRRATDISFTGNSRFYRIVTPALP